MNEFQSLEQVQVTFTSGKFPFGQNVTVGGVEYHLRGSSKFTFEDMVVKGYKGIIVYSCGHQHRQEAVQAGLDEWLLFIWAFDSRQILQPVTVRATTSHRGAPVIDSGHGITEARAEGRDDNIIGDKVAVRFTSLPGSQALKGKVDTGAEICSLHADKWSIKGGKIQFISPALSPNIITMNLYDHQAVKSANGVQYRPVIELNIRINDRLINGVLFNLADRSHMEFPVLIGQNALEKGKFLIDPRIREEEEGEIDWEGLMEDVKDVAVKERPYDPERAQKIYQLLKDNDVSFNELIRHIRTEVVSTYEDIKY